MFNNKKLSKWGIWLQRVLISGIILLACYFIFQFYYNLYFLKEEGAITSAYIYDIHSSIRSNNMIKSY